MTDARRPLWSVTSRIWIIVPWPPKILLPRRQADNFLPNQLVPRLNFHARVTPLPLGASVAAVDLVVIARLGDVQPQSFTLSYHQTDGNDVHYTYDVGVLHVKEVLKGELPDEKVASLRLAFASRKQQGQAIREAQMFFNKGDEGIWLLNKDKAFTNYWIAGPRQPLPLEKRPKIKAMLRAPGVEEQDIPSTRTLPGAMVTLTKGGPPPVAIHSSQLKALSRDDVAAVPQLASYLALLESVNNLQVVPVVEHPPHEIVSPILQNLFSKWRFFVVRFRPMRNEENQFFQGVAVLGSHYVTLAVSSEGRTAEFFPLGLNQRFGKFLAANKVLLRSHEDAQQVWQAFCHMHQRGYSFDDGGRRVAAGRWRLGTVAFRFQSYAYEIATDAAGFITSAHWNVQLADDAPLDIRRHHGHGRGE